MQLPRRKCGQSLPLLSTHRRLFWQRPRTFLLVFAKLLAAGHTFCFPLKLRQLYGKATKSN